MPADKFPLEFSLIRNQIQGEDPIKTNHITALCGTKNGRIWLGTYGGGVIQYNHKTNQFQPVEFESGHLQTPTNKYINRFFTDKAGIVWVATEDGAYKYNSNQSLFISHRFNPYTSTKDPFIYVNNILEDETGRIWLAGMGMGVVCLDDNLKQSTHFTQKSAPSQKIISDNIRCIARDKSGTMYIGTFTQGVQQIKLNSKNQILETRLLTHEPANINSLASNAVRSIHIDKQGTVWFASPEGLTKFIPKNNTFKHFQHQSNNSSSLSNNFISCIFEENDNTLWLGTQGGVNIFNKKTEEFIPILHRSDKINSPDLNYVLCITKSSDSIYWFGTFGGGLNAYHAPSGELTTYTSENGLPSDIVYGCMEDSRGNLWLSTSNGISHFDRTLNTFRNYGLEDGLQSLDFNSNSYLKSRNGNMYFGGTYGFNQINPDSLSVGTRDVSLVLTDLKILNKHIKVGKTADKNILLQKSINYTDTLTLNYPNESFTIDFATLDFASPERVNYTYKIDNLNKEWIDLGTENHITFHSLPPGYYTLWIDASSDQIHVSTPLQLTLHILPPWWKEWWFQAIAVFLFLSIVYALYAVRIAMLRFRQKELETIVAARTSELTSVNQILEEQAEELNAQHEQLYEVNQLLEEQYEEIEQQKNELAIHRNNLEKLVEQRTEELEVAKHRAEESDRLKSSFLANVSHEIRTPLNAIVGFSSLLNDPELEPWQREYFTQMIDSSSQMLLVLIDDILDLSKIEAHQINLKLSYFDINELLSELKETYCKQNSNSDVKIYIAENTQKNSTLIRTDRIRLWQILNNFASNALKFTKSGYIELGYHFNKKREITIYVKDTGIGIDKEHHDIIFERFRKIENDSQKFHRGTGLGLAISKRLAELLGGRVELESEPGKGSIFSFSFKDESLQ
jgi:signal transduction histidine kinase/streptogramin lyase